MHWFFWLFLLPPRRALWQRYRRFLHWLCVSLFGQHATPRRYAVRKIRQTYHHRRKPEWVKHDLVQMYRETRLSARKLADAFNWCHTATHGTTVGKTYVSQVIRDYLYKAARMSERTKRHVPVSPPRNDTWGMDMTGKGDTNDIVHAIFGVIDHGSRMALAMHPLPDRTALTLLKALIAVIEVCGKPRVIKTDNETCFTSRLFHFGLALLRIEHRRSRPGRPWENGRIERLFVERKARSACRAGRPGASAGAWRVSVLVQRRADASAFGWLDAVGGVACHRSLPVRAEVGHAV